MRLQGTMQEVFHCNEPEVLVEGPAGTGKTWTDHLRTISICEAAPGSMHLYTRQVRADMGETVLKSLEAALGETHPMVLGGASREHRKVYEFPNGSQIVVAGLDRPERTYSGEYDTVTIFEAADVPYDSYQRLFRTLRGKRSLPFKQLRVEINPDGPTHWVNQYFGNRDGMRRFCTRHKDNPYLWDDEAQQWTEEGSQFIGILRRMTGHQRARLLDGKWQGAEGMIYDAWDRDVHVIKEMPDGWQNWRVIRSIDFGFTNPFVCQWWAVDPDGRIYLFRERVLCEVRTEVHAPYIASTNHEPVLTTVADPENAEGIQTLAIHGVASSKADKAILRGIESLQSRLIVRPDGKPRLFVLESALQERCPKLQAQGKPCGFLEEIGNYSWSKPREGKAHKEEPNGIDDHSMDTARYASVEADRLAGSSLLLPRASTHPAHDINSWHERPRPRPQAASLLGQRWRRA